MTLWQALLLGAVQGFTEFLPVSSTGHLAILQQAFGFYNNPQLAPMMLLFDTALHVGTLVAVFAALWGDVVGILKKPLRPLTLYLILATIPAVIVTLLFGGFLDKVFSGQYIGFIGYCFLITSVILFMTANIREGKIDMEKMGIFKPLLIGLMQAFAILPGVSRSGSTIFGGLATGVKREDAARFSFLMSIVAILGSVVLQAKDVASAGIAETLGVIGAVPLIASMAMAAITGFIALKLVIKAVKSGKLWMFGIYTAAVGILVLVDFYVTHLVF
jgi:undecaprenyl-diphosphatase